MVTLTKAEERIMQILWDMRKGFIKDIVDEKIPLLCEGGYVPGCDHAMPPDIPWENYLYYRELLLNVEL